MRALCFSMLCAMCVMVGAGGQAQPGAGMSQGEASINVRSDVKLGIKGTGGTTTERLTQLGGAVSAQMGEIRGCYRKLVASSPEVVGNLRVQLALAKGERPKVTVEATSGSADELRKCVTRVIEKAKYDDVGRPAAAVLSLEFDNTRARGQALMQKREQSVSAVDVQAQPDGTKAARFSTDGKEVSFVVSGAATQRDEHIELVTRAFHAGYAGFLDCRRRCEKGGLSPEGDIEAELSLDARGKAKVKLGKITVAHQRASMCAERAFKRLDFEKPGAPVRVGVAVHFSK